MTTPSPEAPALLRGAAREKLDLTIHGEMLTEGQGSPDVLINDEGAWRERISKHTCVAHGEEIVLAGVQQIYINDVRAVRIHDYLKGTGPLDAIVTGSPDVFMGDEGFGFSSRDEFCKKFNELMAAWPTMTEAERRAGMQTLVNDMSASQGMPAPTVNTGTADAASFNPWTWQMNLPENQNALYAGSSGSTNIYAEPNLSDHEQCKFGETVVHELRHQQMGWNGLRKIAQEPSIQSSLTYWPYTEANLPPSVWTAAQDSPIPAGSPEDTAGANAVWDYYNGDFAADMANYSHSPGGSDAARHETAVGCCTSGA